MSRVQLVVTGDMELAALGSSLRHAFPEHELEFLPTQKVQDFTSTRLGRHPGRAPGLKTRAQQMAHSSWSTWTSQFDAATHDTEDFQVDDPAYRRWLERRAPNAVDPHRHPKQYIRYLCDPSANIERAYRETQEGVRALEQLAWAEVTARADREHYARALFEDFAEGIGADWSSPGPVAPLTARRSGGLLRNLALATS